MSIMPLIDHEALIDALGMEDIPVGSIPVCLVAV